MATANLLLRAAAVFWIVVYLATAVWRARFPFELEAVEGHCLQQVCRVLAGQTLYVAPSLDFVPLRRYCFMFLERYPPSLLTRPFPAEEPSGNRAFLRFPCAKRVAGTIAC